MKQSSIASIEKIIRKNLETRGLGKIELTGELGKSAQTLLHAESVLILTGFVIKDTATGKNAGETDGPIGAVSLGSGLVKLGKKVTFITDVYSEKMLKNACDVLSLSAPIEVAIQDGIEHFCNGLLAKYQPTHVVAIERPGRNKEGKCFSMRGEDLSDLVPNTDMLFTKSHAKGIKTIAVGDGGNEVGMGRIKTQIMASVENGTQICAEVSADHLIIAGVSNWGGHALTGALSVLSGQTLLHSGAAERDMLRGMLEAGAVDGCTKRQELTVDGFSLSENIDMLESIKLTVETYLNGGIQC